MKEWILRMAPVLDLVAAPLIWASALVLKAVRRIGVSRMPVSKRIFERVGVFPIVDHYYEPLFNLRRLRSLSGQDRELPGIKFNIENQLKILDEFEFNNELLAFPLERPETGGIRFYYNNGFFEPGDAEYLYNIIRLFKPKNIIEIGSGFSTLISAAAINKNKQVSEGYDCTHVAIEPYENIWLEQARVNVVRDSVENVGKDVFGKLSPNDILFIDSSHVIRPHGDVLFEYLELLPVLNAGVLVHIHDIFTPRDYPEKWLIDEVRLWNEQYLLEAFLSLNEHFEVIGALNFLAHHHNAELSAKCPVYARASSIREPGSFWIRRV